MAAQTPIHRKVTKIGNSYGVTLSKELLNSIHVKLGDNLEVTVNQSAGVIVLRKSPLLPTGLDPQFFEILQGNVNRYRKTIEGLEN